jgi:hypothetical protein
MVETPPVFGERLVRSAVKSAGFVVQVQKDVVLHATFMD